MKSGRRGRRGGRRQKRREAQAREQAAGAEAKAAPAGEAAGAEAKPDPAGEAARAEEVSPTPEPAAAPAIPAHPRPMSARELVARLEAKRLEAVHSAPHEADEASAEHGAVEPGPGGEPGPPRAAGHPGHADPAPAPESSTAGGMDAAVAATPETPPEPRRFTVAGQEWLAYTAGRGTGGTGRVAPARLEAIRFATGAEPERVAAEVLLPGAKLDLLYDDELAELLERGLRSRTGNG